MSPPRPLALTVRAGDAVSWDAVTSVGRRWRIQSNTGLWRAELSDGESYGYVFAEPGVYSYQLRQVDVSTGQVLPYAFAGIVFVKENRGDSPVLIHSPVEGMVFTFGLGVGENVPVVASFADDPVLVERVDFYAGDVLLGSALAPPYQTGFKSQAAGRYRLVAKAVLRDGRVQESPPVEIEWRETYWPILFPPQPLPSGEFLFYYTGGAGFAYLLERSTDLVHWEPLYKMIPSGIWGDVVDERRAWFYRAREWPWRAR